MTRIWQLVTLGMASAACVFREETKSEYVFAQLDAQIEPEMQSFSLPLACPHLAANATCCSEYQNVRMRTYFQAIDLAFSHISGGCDMCAAGLKHLWCSLTCSPQQDTFVTLVNNTELELAVTPDTALSIYEVCKGSAMVMRTPSMQSPIGFLQFQADKSIDSTPLQLRFTLREESALELSFETCAFSERQLYGYDVTPCKCATCDILCSAEVYKPLDFALTIADWLGVGLGYICLSSFLGLIAVFAYLKQHS